MKALLTSLSICCFISLQAQWQVDSDQHISFKINNTSIDERAHWTPNDIYFWTDPGTYQNGLQITPTQFTIFSNKGGGMTNRITINETGYSLVNGADWEVAKIGYDGLGNGSIDIKDGTGNNQAGIFVDFMGNGIVYGDTKTFKVAYPEKEDLDIWYACIEGPEAAIYDRGTSVLKNGEAFIAYSDHYAAMLSPGSTTIQLTPNEWDTYGLAVTKKTDKGFYVKELKGGTGNFSFDWEAKSVRKGKEDFQVIRPKDYLKNYEPAGQEKRTNTNTQLRVDNHKPVEGCAHSQKN